MDDSHFQFTVMIEQKSGKMYLYFRQEFIQDICRGRRQSIDKEHQQWDDEGTR
jgi:hypothetical protein